MSRTDSEVIVVGGGPAGAATAYWLARAGLDVRLLDRAHFPRQKPCGEFFSPGAVAALGRLGVLEAITRSPHARPLRMTVLTGAGESFDLSYDCWTSGQTRWHGGLAMDRSSLDALLVEHARAAGATVEEGVHVSGALVEAGRVVGVRARRGTGSIETLSARVVVGADGANSVIARSLGLALPVRWPLRLGLAAHYEGISASDETGEMHVGSGIACGIASVGHDVSVALAAPIDSKRPGESSSSLFERLVSLIPSASKRLSPGRRKGQVLGVGPLARRVGRSAGPGFLLVGDAAGFFDPFTGEGVHRALVGAEMAAEAVEVAMRRADALPAGYEHSRTAAFGKKELVCELVHLFRSWPWAFDYALRRLRSRPGVSGLLSAVLGDYRYAGDVLTPSFMLALLRP